MGVIKEVLLDKINGYNQTQFRDSDATILEYDKTTMTCKIKYQNPNGEGYIYRGDVEIAGVWGGFSPGGIHAGQECTISFINNNIYNPIITGMPKSFYAEKSCTDQGAYIADDEIWKVGKPNHIIAMVLDWIDEANEDLTKYENDAAQYTETNVDLVSLDLFTALDKFMEFEVGMTNLKNKSTVKLRDNGDIDLFTRNNTGIRICDDGVVKIYAQDVEFTNSLTDTTDKSISTQLKVGQITKICIAYHLMEEIDKYVAEIEQQRFSKSSSSTSSADTGIVNITGGKFNWPVWIPPNGAPGTITSRFGPRWGTVHRGLDIGCPTDSKILAGEKGTVIGADYHASMGNYVLLDHGNGVQTVYMHNRELLVTVGQEVERGQQLAWSDSTGDSTGPHCHFGVKINGEYVNPEPYLDMSIVGE